MNLIYSFYQSIGDPFVYILYRPPSSISLDPCQNTGDHPENNHYPLSRQLDGILNGEISWLRELEKVAQIVHMSGQWEGRSNDGHARKRIFMEGLPFFMIMI